jgi:hypothetical protein
MEQQCQAHIRQRDEWGIGSGAYGRQCSRDAMTHVCGIYLCDQHRRMVTRWLDGREQLDPRADRMFAAWGAAASQPFVSEDDQLDELDQLG